MDIKTRIDAMTEREAKAALEWFVKKWALNMPCGDCELFMRCSYRNVPLTTDISFCENTLLDDALKEARK